MYEELGVSAILGYSIHRNLSQNRIERLKAAQDRALAQFGNLECRAWTVGDSHLELWGRRNIEDQIHGLPDGSVLILTGSPHKPVSWPEVEARLLNIQKAADYILPWEGRVVLIRVSADGRRWTMWNDWLGMIPVFYSRIEDGWIASTLEPVVVAAADYGPHDFFLPGLVSLMINGHFLSDWTLYSGMKMVEADSAVEWDDIGCHVTPIRSVKPGEDRWESSWDDLVDELHALSHGVIAAILRTQPCWTLPLSSGLDSRLIAAVAADTGTAVRAFTWGAPDSEDVVYAREVSRTLEIPWKRINPSADFLKTYTRRWADWFGSSLHFHGMYVMGFLDCLENEADAPILSGLAGDVLAGAATCETEFHKYHPGADQLLDVDHTFWTSRQLRDLLSFPIEEAVQANIEKIKTQVAGLPGANFQKITLLILKERLHSFVSFQCTAMDYWRGVVTPFIDREYARFWLSLPRAVLDNRRLLGDLFRRYYGKLAVIPGSYAGNPLIVTGRYLAGRRLAYALPSSLLVGPLTGFAEKPLRLDIDSIQHSGREALWPIFETAGELKNWLDMDRLEQDFQALMRSKEDILPLRRLQTAQVLAYRVIKRN